MAIGFSNAALAHSSDFNPGSGVTTMSATSENVLDAGGFQASLVGGNMAGTPAGHPVAWWLAFVALLVVLKYAAEAAGKDEEFRNIRIGVFNITTITLSAMLGLIFLKWFTGLYKIPGLSDLVQGV